MKYILEYAGFNGDVNYIKQLLYYKGIIPIENSKNGALITIGFNGGIIYPLKYNYLSNNASNINYIHLSDKLKIDTNYIYGFSSTGLGPRAQIQRNYEIIIIIIYRWTITWRFLRWRYFI